MTDQTEENKEKDLYQQTFRPICNRLGIEGVVTVARWSYTSNKLKLFFPIYVGNLTNGQINKLNAAFDDSFDEALKKFSFTQLIADNKREVGFHFKNGQNQVNFGNSNGIDLVEISLDKIDTKIIDKLCEEFVKPKIRLYRYGNLHFSEFAESHKDAINNTLNKAILNLFSSGITNIYFIPLSIPSSTKEVAGIVAVNVMQEHDFSELVHILRPFVQGIMAPFHIQELDNLRMSYALRSATAAIMGRNMSHNIGSHAIWYLAEQLKDSGPYSHVEHFLRYLQRRMDFIAQVSTSAPSWCLTMKWKDIMDSFRNQNCLLDNIGWSNKVRYCQHWFDNSDRLPSMQKPEKRLEMKLNGTDVSVDIPHGQIGTQAFYTILENLIRNAAKFGNWESVQNGGTGVKPFTFTIKIEECNEDYFRVFIYDNLPSTQKTVQELSNSLAQPIIDRTGEIKPGNWGMKEIKICAAYLRMVKQEQIDAKFDEWKDGRSKEPPIIEVKLTDGNWNEVKERGHLTHILYLFRPKEALLVGKALQKEA